MAKRKFRIVASSVAGPGPVRAHGLGIMPGDARCGAAGTFTCQRSNTGRGFQTDAGAAILLLYEDPEGKAEGVGGFTDLLMRTDPEDGEGQETASGVQVYSTEML